jgi:hypothetical protein
MKETGWVPVKLQRQEAVAVDLCFKEMRVQGGRVPRSLSWRREQARQEKQEEHF